MKDAGFDFLRGSHYPRTRSSPSPRTGAACLFLSESLSGARRRLRTRAPRPTDRRPACPEGFEASVKQQLTEMIPQPPQPPVHRGLEPVQRVFFTAKAETLPAVRRLLRELVLLSHQLDPARLASVSGAQRGRLDHSVTSHTATTVTVPSCSPTPGCPSFVAEYGSTIADRPRPLRPPAGATWSPALALAGPPVGARPTSAPGGHLGRF